MTHQLHLTSETFFIRSNTFVGGYEDKGEFGVWQHSMTETMWTHAVKGVLLRAKTKCILHSGDLEQSDLRLS